MEIQNEMEIKQALVSKNEANIVFIRLKEKYFIDVEDIKEINKAKNKLVGESCHSVIFIPSITSSISKEAREFSAQPIIFKNAICKAIVAKNMAHRLIGNFFIKMQNPPVPMKLFNSEEKAVQWVKTKIEKFHLVKN